jgi:hypothetical protein
LDFVYIARQNTINGQDLTDMEHALERFHKYRKVFIKEGVFDDVISLPRQHSLVHYVCNICLFGAPNGLCLSITESKHIDAVKKPWRRLSRYMALSQMLITNQRMEKMAAARVYFEQHGMLDGTTLSYTARKLLGTLNLPLQDSGALSGDPNVLAEDDDRAPVAGWKEESKVALAALQGTYNSLRSLTTSFITVPYPRAQLSTVHIQSRPASWPFSFPYSDSALCLDAHESGLRPQCSGHTSCQSSIHQGAWQNRCFSLSRFKLLRSQ